MHSLTRAVLASLLIGLCAIAAPPIPPDEAAQPEAKQPNAASFPEGEKLLKVAADELAGC